MSRWFIISFDVYKEDKKGNTFKTGVGYIADSSGFSDTSNISIAFIFHEDFDIDGVIDNNKSINKSAYYEYYLHDNFSKIYVENDEE